MVVLSTDHFIKDEAAFIEALRMASRVAREGFLVTLGAKPNRPKTAYGHIEAGESLSASSPSYRVKKFIEKPNHTKAIQSVEDKNTL